MNDPTGLLADKKRYVKDAQGRIFDTHPKVKAAQERYYKETHRKDARKDQQK